MPLGSHAQGSRVQKSFRSPSYSYRDRRNPDKLAHVSDSFSSSLLENFPQADDRRPLAKAASEMGLPSSEREEWRYSPVGELDLDRYRPAVDGDSVDRSTDREDALGVNPTIVIENGWLREVAEIDGVEIIALGQPGELDISVSATESERIDAGWGTKIDLLHAAFCPQIIEVRVGRGVVVDEPILIRHQHGGGDIAAFPHVRVRAEADSEVRLVETFASPAAGGLTVPVTEFHLSDAARVSYVQFQDLATDHWMLARQFWRLGNQTTARGGVAAFGGRYARTRIDSMLEGRGADSNLAAVYYGDGSQVLDFRVFQHHIGQGTRSDLLFKGTQDEKSTSVYTGMIHIHPTGAGSNAFQTNRNLKLSEDAWAWSVPNLEIENDEVRCSHASTISPVDADHAFYLQSRGVPPGEAERLVVGGFLHAAIERLPIPAVRGVVENLVVNKLNRRESA